MLVLALKTSRYERLFLLLCHAAAVVAITQSNLLPAIAWLLGLVISVSLLVFCEYIPVANRQPLQRIEIAATEAVLVFADSELRCLLPKVDFFSGWLIVLRFDLLRHTDRQLQSKGERPIFVRLLPDSLPADQERQLRRYLRFSLA